MALFKAQPYTYPYPYTTTIDYIRNKPVNYPPDLVTTGYDPVKKSYKHSFLKRVKVGCAFAEPTLPFPDLLS